MSEFKEQRVKCDGTLASVLPDLNFTYTYAYA